MHLQYYLQYYLLKGEISLIFLMPIFFRSRFLVRGFQEILGSFLAHC